MHGHNNSSGSCDDNYNDDNNVSDNDNLEKKYESDNADFGISNFTFAAQQAINTAAATNLSAPNPAVEPAPGSGSINMNEHKEPAENSHTIVDITHADSDTDTESDGESGDFVNIHSAYPQIAINQEDELQEDHLSELQDLGFDSFWEDRDSDVHDHPDDVAPDIGIREDDDHKDFHDQTVFEEKLGDHDDGISVMMLVTLLFLWKKQYKVNS